MKNSLFYAKILLFGEYGLIENSKGLTVPYDFYNGILKYNSIQNSISKKSNEDLLTYFNFLENVTVNKLDKILDFLSLKKDIKDGLHFDSTIPQGYGIGSSGALVAAIYNKYAFNKIFIEKDNFNKEKLNELKNIFSTMESFFHGKSSGIDPLICYLNIPLIINSKNDIDFFSLNPSNNGSGAIFLIDSKQVGKTAPMIEFFFNKLKNEGFRTTLKNEFIKYNNSCVDAFSKGELNKLFLNLKELSSWVFLNLKPMIPEKMYKLWMQGIETNLYYLKLCGSGNGGFILGFTKDFDKAHDFLKDYSPEIVYRF